METLLPFERILIAVDDSKYSYHAATYGFSLARQLQSTVALVHINEFPIAANMTTDPFIGDSGVVLPELLDIQKEGAQRLFKHLRKELAPDLDVIEFILEGNITDEVIRTAKEFDASVIVIGTHSRTGFSHFLSGSVAENISRHAKCPVLIVPTIEEKKATKQ